MVAPAKRRALGAALAVATLGVAGATLATSPPAGATSPGGGDNCPATNPPNTLTPANGTPQTAQLETAFVQPLGVVLANTNGCPVTTALAGTPITFTAPASGPSATFAVSGANTLTVDTDATGAASASTFTANDTAGSYTVTATSIYGTVVFDLTNSCPPSNPPNTLKLQGGTPQTAQLDSAFAQPLAVALANTNGCPVTTAVAGTPITFAAPAHGASGSFAASGSHTLTLGTDASGGASAQMVTANDTAGSYTATATSTYGSVSFALTNSAAGMAARIAPLAPTHQSATAGTRYPHALSARVLDADGVPVSGAMVTFSLGTAGGGGAGGGSGAGASFADGSNQASEQTNSQGVATSPTFRANNTAGTFTARAASAHVTQPATFTLHNLPAKPTTIARIGPSDRDATIDSGYTNRLQVKVRNGHGGAVTGASVTFSLGSAGGGAGAGAGGAGVSFAGGGTQATATTNSQGVATSPRLTANSVTGNVTATATLTSTRATTRFRLRNLPGAPAMITAGVAANEATAAGTRFMIPLAVTVIDAHGNRVGDTPVTFTAPAVGASGSFDGRRSVTVRTDSSGIAVAPPFSANGQPGGYIVEATAGHARAAAFALVNRAP
jgi:hypothetical protein